MVPTGPLSTVSSLTAILLAVLISARACPYLPLSGIRGSWVIKHPFRNHPGRTQGRELVWGRGRTGSSGVPVGQAGAASPLGARAGRAGSWGTAPASPPGAGCTPAAILARAARAALPPAVGPQSRRPGRGGRAGVPGAPRPLPPEAPPRSGSRLTPGLGRPLLVKTRPVVAPGRHARADFNLEKRPPVPGLLNGPRVITSPAPSGPAAHPATWAVLIPGSEACSTVPAVQGVSKPLSGQERI